MKKNMLIVGIFFMGFLVNTICMLTGCLESFDTIIYDSIVKLQSPFFDVLFKSVTQLGNVELLIISICLLSIFFNSKNRRLFLITIVTEVLLNYLIKIIIQRPRPNISRMVDVSGFSYPSGHAMITVGLYGFIMYWVFKNIKNKPLRVVLLCLLTLLIIHIDISRIYLGVHYPSDVVGGLLLGIAVLIFVITLMNHRRFKPFITEDKLKNI